MSNFISKNKRFGTLFEFSWILKRIQFIHDPHCHIAHLLICEPHVAFHWAIGSYPTHLVPKLFTLYVRRQGNANHVFQLLTKYNVLLSRTYIAHLLSHILVSSQS